MFSFVLPGNIFTERIRDPGRDRLVQHWRLASAERLLQQQFQRPHGAAAAQGPPQAEEVAARAALAADVAARRGGDRDGIARRDQVAAAHGT